MSVTQIAPTAKGLVAAKLRFIERGESIAQWARARGYKPRTVYAVLSGELQCRRGLTHQIAVELGVKPRPLDSGAHQQ